MIHLFGHLLEGGYRAYSILRLLDYLSTRAIGAAMTAFILMLVVMPRFIWYLHHRGLVDQTRETGVPSAFDKAGTPVMGGAVMVGCVLAACLLWCDLTSSFLWPVLGGLLWFGGIGLADDLAKWRARSGNRGMSEIRKLMLQGAFAALFAAFLASPWSPLPAREAGAFYVPFVKHALFTSEWGYLPIVFLFVMLVGNAVNITDGLDGLAIVPSVFAVSALGVFAWVMGNAIWARYLFFPLLPGVGELVLVCAAFAGAGVGFLWFNAYPAQVFMGDSGSLAIGGCLATLSVLVKQEALFLILGGLFIAEAVTSQIQDKIGIKWLGRRLFYRAPLHHQLQHTGLAETKVVIRLWIVSLILTLVAIATVKLR
ncbi:MAG: phospho-N-acetylmuramoyl-pentapeptide-transferase [Acidobacteria bacterium]|nr:phospho-N-acetylmuramoyl-pentapeptide-transferase [Acidobacteriota bacterium]